MSLYFGSKFIIPLTNYCASELNSQGKVKSPFKINLCKSSRLDALKGTVPHNMANKSTPNDHTSTKKPSYPLSIIISGAKYAGVPHYSYITYPFLIILETPKSHILTPFSQSKSMLSSLISL